MKLKNDTRNLSPTSQKTHYAD